MLRIQKEKSIPLYCKIPYIPNRPPTMSKMLRIRLIWRSSLILLVITKYSKGPAKKRGNSFTLTKKLLDQIRERMQIKIKLKMDKFRGVEVNLISSLLIILSTQNIKANNTKISVIVSLAGVKTVIQRG